MVEISDNIVYKEFIDKYPKNEGGYNINKNGQYTPLSIMNPEDLGYYEKHYKYVDKNYNVIKKISDLDTNIKNKTNIDGVNYIISIFDKCHKQETIKKIYNYIQIDHKYLKFYI
jgi:hypothetical protein